MRKIRSLLSATSDKEKLSLKVSGNARGPSATNLRARAASLQVNIPRRSRSSTLGTRSSSPRGRDAPPAYPPMRPLSDKPHFFKLSKIEKNKITFQGISEGSHRKLSYERVAQDHFIIRFQTFEGRDVKINLSPPPRNTFTF